MFSTYKRIYFDGMIKALVSEDGYITVVIEVLASSDGSQINTGDIRLLKYNTWLSDAHPMLDYTFICQIESIYCDGCCFNDHEWLIGKCFRFHYKGQENDLYDELYVYSFEKVEPLSGHYYDAPSEHYREPSEMIKPSLHAFNGTILDINITEDYAELYLKYRTTYQDSKSIYAYKKMNIARNEIPCIEGLGEVMDSYLEIDTPEKLQAFLRTEFIFTESVKRGVTVRKNNITKTGIPERTLCRVLTFTNQ